MAKIEYCPRCGASGFRRYRHGEEWMCKCCGHVVAHDGLAVAWLKLERPRVVSAAIWLTERYQQFTRQMMAEHLGVTKSPSLRAAVDALVDIPAFQKFSMPHPQNGCSTWFYARRQQPW